MKIKYSVFIKSLHYDFKPIIIIYTSSFDEPLKYKRSCINQYTGNIVVVHSEDELNKILNMCWED